MTASYLGSSHLCRNLALCLIFGALATSLLAQTAPSPAPAAGNNWSNLPENKRKEYEYGLSMRTKWLAKLPEGSVTALDLPYVKNPVQGGVPDSNQTLDLFVPKGQGPFPLIIWIHGGAWKGGNKNQLGAEMASRWLPEGFAVASLNYRFVMDAPFPGMFQDCIDAVAFLRGHAAQYHLNPGKIGIIGASAGAHIAGLVAMTEGSQAYANSGAPVQAAVLMCGFYDMTMETGHWAPGKFVSNPKDDFSYLYPNRAYDPAIAKKMSPVYQIHAGSPPVLLIHGDKDINTAPIIQSQLFEEALGKAGKQVTLTNYPEYDHNLWHPDVIAQTLAFFKEKLQHP